MNNKMASKVKKLGIRITLRWAQFKSRKLTEFKAGYVSSHLIVRQIEINSIPRLLRNAIFDVSNALSLHFLWNRVDFWMKSNFGIDIVWY